MSTEKGEEQEDHIDYHQLDWTSRLKRVVLVTRTTRRNSRLPLPTGQGRARSTKDIIVCSVNTIVAPTRISRIVLFSAFTRQLARSFGTERIVTHYMAPPLNRLGEGCPFSFAKYTPRYPALCTRLLHPKLGSSRSMLCVVWCRARCTFLTLVYRFRDVVILDSSFVWLDAVACMSMLEV